MKKNQSIGIILLGIGVFFIYWAQTHSPKNLGKVIGNAFSGSYTMSEFSYYTCLGLGIAIGLYGILKLMKKA
ncbi:MAG: hypothetical protein ABJF11_01740 [Reichenbachiella sp.]|uniref:hypothetical protein n=1 Tax=Reichenbachiella sp. TaxID=2184521 RepID=UPI0032652F3B